MFDAKFMLPWSFSEEAAAEKHMARLQRNMLVANPGKSVLSIINGGGKWVELSVEACPIHQTVLIAAEKAFWQAVKNRAPPVLFDCEPPKPRVEAVRVPPGDEVAWWERLDYRCRRDLAAALDFDATYPREANFKIIIY